MLLDWPASLLTPDILFLIPLPWWGPVLSPVLIAMVFAGAGAVMIALDDRDRAVRFAARDGALFATGILVALYAFMADAIAALPADAETLSQVRPTGFRWGVYGAGLLLMTAGIARPILAARRGGSGPSPARPS